MIEFRCGKCGALYQVNDDQVAQEVPCQWCGEDHLVPDPDAPPSGTLKFRCPECDVLLGVSAAYAGQKVQCDRCDAVVVVPQAPSDAPRRIPGPAPRARPLRRDGAPAARRPSPQPASTGAPSDPPPAPPPAPGEIIEFRCQFCGHGFRVSRELAGRKGKCKECGAVNVVPSGGS